MVGRQGAASTTAATGLAVLLAGCNADLANSDRAAYREGVPEDLYKTLLPATIAYGISRECSGFNFSKYQWDKDLDAAIDATIAKGYTRNDINHWRRTALVEQVETGIIVYANERQLDPEDPDALCRAGRDEIAGGTSIGRYLRVR